MYLDAPRRGDSERWWADAAALLGDRLDWMPSVPFDAAMSWVELSHGGAWLRDAAGRRFYITSRTLALLIPDMDRGTLHATWVFRKRGRRFVLEREGQLERRRCRACDGRGLEGSWGPVEMFGLMGRGFIATGKCRKCWGSGLTAKSRGLAGGGS